MTIRVCHIDGTRTLLRSTFKCNWTIGLALKAFGLFNAVPAWSGGQPGSLEVLEIHEWILLEDAVSDQEVASLQKGVPYE